MTDERLVRRLVRRSFSEGGSTECEGGTVTRRDFVKIGGALFVSVSLPHPFGASTAEAAGTLDATKLAAWLEIHADGTIVARTGKTEMGTGASAFFTQAVADELDVDPASITLIMGHTDETPDGGFSAAFTEAVKNLQKVASMTRTALVGLASTKLGVPVERLTVANGIVSGDGKRIAYTELVKGQQLDLTIPVIGRMPTADPKDSVGVANLFGLFVGGNPPLKRHADYKVVGTNYHRPGIRDIVTGTAQFSSDITVPGMLHARMVRPATLGSTLIAAGKLDRAKFPTAEVVTKSNLVAVVSPNEWEAVQAAQAVTAGTTWTPWSGLPSSDKLMEHLHGVKWIPSGKQGNEAKIDAALAGAAKVLSATYEQPYVRHAPIGAFVAVADVKPDGAVIIWAQTAQAQGARVRLAYVMGVPVEKVTIRCAEGPGQFGRTTWGGDGAMADAAILSQLVGKPVRVRWTLTEDLAWSSVSPAYYADVKVGVDAQGNMVGFKNAWHGPHASDARMIGATLAGNPEISPNLHPHTTPADDNAVSGVSAWLYKKSPAFDQSFSCENVGENPATHGIRGNIMRTPGQRKQNYAIESIINEAAAAAGVDAIEYRLRHTTDDVFARILRQTADAHGWTSRPSPNPNARRAGATPVRGRGVSAANRFGATWVAIAEVEVTPSTGVVKLTALTVGVDVGKVLNPKHLESNMRGGAVMGVGEALFEEVTFDASKITSNDWTKYRIPHMADLPDIKAVFTSRDDRGFHSGGEAANIATPSAIMAAVFDATGAMPRRIPLKPEYVKALLGGESKLSRR